MGKRADWAAMETLPLGQLDDSENAQFKWWLWLANLGPLTKDVLGTGAVALRTTKRTAHEVHLLCTRADDSFIEFALSDQERLRLIQ